MVTKIEKNTPFLKGDKFYCENGHHRATAKKDAVIGDDLSVEHFRFKKGNEIEAGEIINNQCSICGGKWFYAEVPKIGWLMLPYREKKTIETFTGKKPLPRKVIINTIFE